MNDTKPTDNSPNTTGLPQHGLGFLRDVLIILMIAISGLYLGRTFIIPLVVAILLFTLLIALVDKIVTISIGKKHFPRGAAVILSLLMIFAGIGVIAVIFANQWGAVVEAAPKYHERLNDILNNLFTVVGDKNADAINEAIAKIDISGWMIGTLGSVGSFTTSFMLVCLYIPFLALERPAMKKKIVIAASTSQTLSEIRSISAAASKSLQTYIGIKTLVSLMTGAISYGVMKYIGLDFAETWGVLAFALNFIPSIGSVIAVILPALVALVQFDTLGPFLIVVFGCGVIQFLIGNVLEPNLMGKSLNLSPLTVIISLTFWASIWGIPGALLSVPLSVCIMIVLSHLPNARWIAVLMSGDGILTENPEET